MTAQYLNSCKILILAFFRMSDGLIFFLCLLDCGGLLGLNVYFLILLSDLECDYINASNACKKLNNFVMVSFNFLKNFKMMSKNFFSPKSSCI